MAGTSAREALSMSIESPSFRYEVVAGVEIDDPGSSGERNVDAVVESVRARRAGRVSEEEATRSLSLPTGD